MSFLRIAQHVGLMPYDGEKEWSLFARRLLLVGLEMGALWLLLIALITVTRLWTRCP